MTQHTQQTAAAHNQRQYVLHQLKSRICYDCLDWIFIAVIVL